MNELMQNLVEALREELKQYGEMLALLDHQQQMVVSRQGPELLHSVAAIDAQAESIRIAREEREQRRRHLARTLKLGEAAGFKEMSASLPANYRPLVEALVQENNQLLRRVQQRAHQNHMLLHRSVELMQRLLNALNPGANPGVYTDAGLIPANSCAPEPLYNAIG
jgi:flagellar biosynthesis/type III secretory pathway chaperone